MPSLRRLTAFLLALLLLPLTLRGGERSCGAHERAGEDAHVAGAMPAAHASHEALGDPSPDRMPSDACGTERAPSACASMPSCATTISLAEGLGASATLAATVQRLPDTDQIDSRPTAGPDVPPPRG